MSVLEKITQDTEYKMCNYLLRIPIIYLRGRAFMLLYALTTDECLTVVGVHRKKTTLAWRDFVRTGMKRIRHCVTYMRGNILIRILYYIHIIIVSITRDFSNWYLFCILTFLILIFFSLRCSFRLKKKWINNIHFTGTK